MTADIGVTNNLPIITILRWYEINISNAFNFIIQKVTAQIPGDPIKSIPIFENLG